MSSLDFKVPLDSPIEGMNADFVVRSLRRRLWRAFQEDDAETALRAYQATFDDFQKWLEEEEQERMKSEDGSPNNATSSKHRRRREREPARTRSKSRTRRPRRRSSAEIPKSKRPSLEDNLPDTVISTADIHKSTRSILQSRMNPSEPFIADDLLSPYSGFDKPAQKTIPTVQSEEEKKRVRKAQRRPRSAFNVFSFRKDLKDVVELNRPEDTDEVFHEDVNMTTPLHEAARIGSSSLIRFFLANSGDANVKNGRMRTALHMCCGGVTKEECRLIVALNKAGDKAIAGEAGIRAPKISKEVLDLMKAEAESDNKKKRGKKSVAKFKAVSKILMRTHTKSTNDKAQSPEEAPKPRFDFTSLNELSVQRIDVVLNLLSWSHKNTGVGVSLNAVDDVGRTSLHYAAEMGRAEICSAIMANFGTMFTIVDEIGSRTPCECAARQGHKGLAAQLEARALLYIDPYGLDEELMASVETPYMDDEDGNALAPPFNWFKTVKMKDISEERKRRLANGRERILKALEQYQSKSEAKREAKTKAEKEKEKANEASPVKTLTESPEEVGFEVAVNGDSATKEVKSSAEEKRPDFSNLQDSHIERLFAHHRWDTYEAVEAFRKNPVRALRKAQIQISSEPKCESKQSGDRTCLICLEKIENDKKWMELEGCPHAFCSDCLQSYVMDCAKSMTPVSKIMCPHHGCTASISQSNLDTLLADLPKTATRVGEATSRHFVSSAYDFKFCNAPGCDGVVKRLPQKFFAKSGYDPDLHDYFGAVCTAGPRNRCPPGSSPTLTYDGVEDSKYTHCKSREQPQRAHRFCFACGEAMHWPCPCDTLKQWINKIRDEVGEVEEEEATDDANELAQRMWIKANTRSCPQCGVLIEKNDGCNHMTCVNPNCRYEFCWICRKDWKLHGSATGGFFRCNIWKEDEELGKKEATQNEEGNEEGGGDEGNDQGYGTAIHSAREHYRKKQEINRFLHHYTRFEAHGQSATLERRMAETASSRLAPVVDAAIEFDGSPAFNFGGKGLSFIHSAFTELLECRSALKYSYAYSFFRYPTFFHFRRIDELNQIRKEKIVFEKYQSELEMITEQMSDVLARSHIRASQVQISFLTAGAAEKRVDFSNLMFSILHEERGKDRQRRDDDLSPKKTKVGRSSGKLNTWASATDERRNVTANIVLDSHIQSLMDDEDGRFGRSDGTEMWACEACTFVNSGGLRCAICLTMRPTN